MLIIGRCSEAMSKYPSYKRRRGEDLAGYGDMSNKQLALLFLDPSSPNKWAFVQTCHENPLVENINVSMKTLLF
jgi:hypothetical protein